MPVRIYDIAKKLGIENKEVLAKAKELGITGARVPSSSLDKITAEYLEDHLKPKSEEPEPEPTPVAPEPIVLVTAPPEEEKEEPKEEPAPVTAETAAEIEPAESETQEVPQAEPQPEVLADSPEPPAPELPMAAKPPPGPKVGDLVGRIVLPAKPQGRASKEARPVRDVRGRGDRVRPGQPQRPKTDFQKPEPKFVAPQTGELITLKPPIIVRELAEQLKRKPFQLIADLIELKVMANVNQAIEEDVALQLCAKYGFRFEVEKRERGGGIVHKKETKIEVDIEDKPEDLKPRAPIVTIMGHVDHGKTSILDVIRKADVCAGESGGITQHIGAYTISFPHPERKKDLQQITFLDTPGHQAFSSMRARGADVTDIVVLVVAANDGVKPQTLEALDHAKAAGVPIIVAVNKCDHPAANPMKVRQQLQEKGLAPDDWGGDTIFTDVSALTKEGIDKLLEMILLQADLLELKANPNRHAFGNVIESGVSPGGPTATVLVRKGTLRPSNTVLCGQFYGKVRALINEEGKRLKEAGPSVAVKLLGLNGVPDAGTEFIVVKDEKAARNLAQERAEDARTGKDRGNRVNLENIFETIAAGTAKVLKLVVKADTQGSVEAIVEALNNISSDKVSLEVIHQGVGTVTESDVNLASASAAVVLGFHTRMDNGVSDVAKHQGVQVKLYSIIYELIDEVKEAMSGLLEPILKENVTGTAEVRKVFELSKGGNVAGCIISNGRIVKGKVRVKRRKNILYEGHINALRRFQDEVNEVRSGMECGIRIEGFNDFEEGDTIESFTIEKVAAQL